jgi:tyrosine aminotransferase
VYSEEHLQQLIHLAERKQVPIVADEIYRDLVFQGHSFTPLAALTSTVPVLSVGANFFLYDA